MERTEHLPPKVVLDHLRAHDERMRAQRDDLSLISALWRTRYWEYIRGIETTRGKSLFWDRISDVEVNRIWPIITAYMASLYPRHQRVVMGEDATGQGDPDKASVATNRWLSGKKINLKVMGAMRQALLMPGAGSKLGYDAGHGNPLDRVFMRIFPWWECLLDHDVTDVDDQRFVGHVYFAPKIEIEERYDLQGLNGTERNDFLESTWENTTSRSGKRDSEKAIAHDDSSAFVRVLEFCNLVDSFTDDAGNVHQGRFEVYLIDQDSLKQKPVFSGPMPFSKPDGTPEPHIKPLIFNADPTYPLRGIPHAQRLLPQLRELNLYRTYQAQASRKDARTFVVKKGALTSQDLARLESGIDGLIIEVGEDEDLSNIIVPVKHSPVSQNITDYARNTEMDLERAAGQSPNARGVVTKATAFEVQNVQQYTESDFGMHAQILEWWLEGVVELLLRVIIAAMQDDGSHLGGDEDSLYEVGGENGPVDDIVAMLTGDEEKEVPEDPQESELLASITGAASVAVPEESVDELGEVEVSGDEISMEIVPLSLKHKNKVMEIIPQDLDASFDVTFLEGAKSPGGDALLQQNIVNLMEPYLGLWDAANGKDHKAFAALTMMRAIATNFDLPRDLDPDIMMEAWQRQEEEEEPEEATEEDEELAGGPQDILQMSVPDALAELERIGVPPEIIQQIADMPEEQAGPAIAQLVEQMEQGGAE